MASTVKKAVGADTPVQKWGCWIPLTYRVRVARYTEKSFGALSYDTDVVSPTYSIFTWYLAGKRARALVAKNEAKIKNESTTQGL